MIHPSASDCAFALLFVIPKGSASLSGKRKKPSRSPQFVALALAFAFLSVPLAGDLLLRLHAQRTEARP